MWFVGIIRDEGGGEVGMQGRLWLSKGRGGSIYYMSWLPLRLVLLWQGRLGYRS